MSYAVGDLVLLNAKNQTLTGPSAKFSRRWLGPFRVSAIPSPDVYTLAMPPEFSGHPNFNVTLLKPFYGTPEEPGSQDPGVPVAPDGYSRPGPTHVTRWGEFFVPERIVDEGRIRGRRGRFFRVNWRGWPSSDDTWEAVSRIGRSHPGLVAEWRSAQEQAAAVE